MSEGIEWAIHAATLLAYVPEGKALSVDDMAAFFEVPRAYLAKHLQHLSRAGIVTSSRGPGGGYRLARPAEKITLLQIVTAIEGSDATFQCTEIRQNGPTGVDAKFYKKPCGIHTAMLNAEQAWRRELGKVSVAAMVEEGAANSHKVQVERAAHWLATKLG